MQVERQETHFFTCRRKDREEEKRAFEFPSRCTRIITTGLTRVVQVGGQNNCNYDSYPLLVLYSPLNLSFDPCFPPTHLSHFVPHTLTHLKFIATVQHTVIELDVLALHGEIYTW